MKKKILKEDEARLIFAPSSTKKSLIEKMVTVVIMVIVIGYMSFVIYRFNKNPRVGEYYIINFENTQNELTETEQNVLLQILGTSGKITKIAYQFGWSSGESVCYIFLEQNKIYKCTGGSGTEFLAFEQIVRNHYKWWKSDEKNIDENKLDKKNIVERSYQ